MNDFVSHSHAAVSILSSAYRCESASGRIGTLLSRTSLSHFTARKGWTEVPCTRLDKGTLFLPPSLRTRSVPIIPSLQACDPEAQHENTSDRNQAGPLKWHPALAEKSGKPVSNTPSQPETVTSAAVAVPNRISPPATTCGPLGSEKTLSSAEAPIGSTVYTAEIAQDLKQKSLSSPKKMSGSHSEINHTGTNTQEDGTVLESGWKSVQYSTRDLHTSSGTRGLKAAGQREIQGQCQGQTSSVYEGAYCFLAKGPSCRGTGNTYAKPSAS